METRGLLPHSDDWNRIRNRIYAELRQAKNKRIQSERADAGGQTVTETSNVTLNLSSFYNLLIVSHKSVDSYETLNVLNYCGFPINVEEDNFWETTKKDFGFSKHDEYPFLVIDSSHEEMPGCELTGKEHILSYLFNKSLIGTYKSYGVYEQ